MEKPADWPWSSYNSFSLAPARVAECQFRSITSASEGCRPPSQTPWHLNRAGTARLGHTNTRRHRHAFTRAVSAPASVTRLKREALSAPWISRLLGVVDQTGHVDYDHRLISHDPGIVSRRNDADITRAKLEFRAVVHSDAQAARKM